ncbi:uncharacterized protein LOC110454487 [Mizuhopecten yessoensis]|uniref:Hepatocyte growth factor n=1 Tax=Mizuhopecten yessoensis TaxID=6573 RepID=A0A210QFD2_MIZYE|nr:uncharacterized protein LOC110454487 [Mizuhopecten yessoensis]OWF47331.1 Hepatocyte growth factor [Mizuhopecten yessoensis]
MQFLRFGKYFQCIVIALMSTLAVVVTSQCLDISTLDSYLHGNRLECYGNCKHVISGVFAAVLCLKECLMFSFCTAVNYNKDALECQLVYIQGALQSDMAIASNDWETVYSTGIPQSLVGECANHECNVDQKCIELTSGIRTCVNHGMQLVPGLYAHFIPNTEQYHLQQNPKLAIYRCTTLTEPEATTSCPISRVVDDVCTPANVSCSATDCFNTSVQYVGRVSCTVNGTLCQRWDTTLPHVGNFLKDRTDLQNWCRIAGETSRPWCYTTDPDVRWEYCPIQDCS